MISGASCSQSSVSSQMWKSDVRSSHSSHKATRSVKACHRTPWDFVAHVLDVTGIGASVLGLTVMSTGGLESVRRGECSHGNKISKSSPAPIASALESPPAWPRVTGAVFLITNVESNQHQSLSGRFTCGTPGNQTGVSSDLFLFEQQHYAKSGPPSRKHSLLERVFKKIAPSSSFSASSHGHIPRMFARLVWHLFVVLCRSCDRNIGKGCE